jgi:Protein of unknown function (DUF3558)
VRRTAQLAAVLAACVIGLAGCASGSAGGAADGEAADGVFPEDSASAQERAEPTEQVESGTSALQPCELLTAEDLTALDLPTETEEISLGPARGCQWQRPHTADKVGGTVTLAIMDALSIDEVVSDTAPKPLTVGSHDAMRYTDGAGGCGISIAVTESSRVDVFGTSDGNLKRGCKIAKRAAELVEQHLP